MSARAFRKLHLQDGLGNEIEDDSDIEEEVPATRTTTNVFDLLANDDEGETTEDWLEEEEEEETTQQDSKPLSSPQQYSKPPSSQKKKKKKKKSKVKSSKEEIEEDVDSILKEFGSPASSLPTPSISSQESKDPLSLTPTWLKSENELRKLFGSKTLNQMQREEAKERNERTRRGVKHRKTLLVTPKDHWPPVPAGVGMECTDSKDGVNYFRIVWTTAYQELQQEFFICVQSMDPNSFQSLLRVHPYHVDSLLQLSEVCKQTGEFETSMDFLQRSIFCFESGWHHLFSPLSGTSRMDYSIEENKTFFLALFRYIQMLGREGCSRTALEYCKLLLSLDPTDPLFVLLIIDYYAVRSGEYEWLLDLFQSPTMVAKKLSSFPNFAFSVALAKFYLQKKKKDTQHTLKEADEALQNALILFPGVLTPLATKASFKLPHSDSSSENLANHGFFSGWKGPDSLQRLITLYVERNYSLWKDPEVTQWLKRNVVQVVEKVYANDSTVTNAEKFIEENYSDSAQNIYHHLLLSEHSDSVDNALPPDLVEAIRHGGGGLQLYEGFQAARNPTVHATTGNPLALFLSTLMPWTPVPNAPPEEGQQDWLVDLLAYLQQQANGDEDQQEGMEQ